MTAAPYEQVGRLFDRKHQPANIRVLTICASEDTLDSSEAQYLDQTRLFKRLLLGFNSKYGEDYAHED